MSPCNYVTLVDNAVLRYRQKDVGTNKQHIILQVGTGESGLLPLSVDSIPIYLVSKGNGRS